MLIDAAEKIFIIYSNAFINIKIRNLLKCRHCLNFFPEAITVSQ